MWRHIAGVKDLGDENADLNKSRRRREKRRKEEERGGEGKEKG